MKRMNFLLIFSLFILLTNCTFKVSAYPPSEITYFEERLPYEAAIYIPHHVGEQSVSKGGLCCIGVVHSWNFMIGESVSEYSEKYLKTLFKDVDVYNTRNAFVENKNIKLVIEPYVKDLKISQTLRMKLNLHTVIQDRTGWPVYESEILGETESYQAMRKACIGGGVMSGESALSDSFSAALEDAFDKLLQDLRTGENWKSLQAMSNRFPQS